MPLLPNILNQELTSFLNQDSPLFGGFPNNQLQTSQKWATAINGYAQGVIPSSVSGMKAKTTMQSILSATNTGTFPILFQQAILAYQVELGLGMQPNFSATPPTIPVIIAPIVSLGIGGAPIELIISSLVSLIELSFRSGLAINNASGVTVPWV